MEYPVVLFDGVCNLCSTSVQFIIKHDNRKVLKFASLQSAFGQKILKQHHLSTTDLNSFILLEGDKIYTRSTGALKVTKYFTGVWRCLYLFIIVPPFIRDGVYRLISKNRYRWFGKKSACWVPTPELRKRFIEL